MSGLLKHYRVDKMGSVTILEDKREGMELFEQTDLAAYTNRTFGMFGGETETVTLGMPDRLVGVVLDRFGKEVDLRSMGDGTFRVRAKVAVSGQFFGWLAGLGAEAKIISPDSVKKQYMEWLTEIVSSIKYKKDV